MLFENVNDEILKKAKIATRNNPHIYLSLYNFEYDIYFSYDKEKKVLFYEAIGEKYLSFFINIASNISFLNGSDEELCLVFFYVIYTKEILFTEEEKKECYGYIYDELTSLSEYSKTELIEKSEFTFYFNELIKEILSEESKVENIKEKLKLNYYFSKNEKDKIELSVKLISKSDKKGTSLFSLTDLIDASYKEKEIEIDGNIYACNPKSFEKNDLEIMHIIKEESNIALYSNKNKRILSSKIFSSILSLLIDKNVFYYYNNTYKKMIVLPYCQPMFIIDEYGKLCSDNFYVGDYYTDGNNIVIIDDKVHLLSFEKEVEKKIYLFLVKHPNLKFELFKKEVADLIIPILGDDVYVNETFKKKYPSINQTIKYYISLIDNELSFKTKLFNDNTEVSLDVFSLNVFGKSILKEFKTELEKLKLPFEGMILDDDEIYDFLKKDISSLKNYAEIYINDSLNKTRVKGVGRINVNINSNIDWLNVDINSALYSNEELNLIIQAYKNEEKYIKIKDNFISFEDENSKNFKEIVDDLQLVYNNKRVPIYQVLKLKSIQSDDVSFIYSDEVKQIFNDIKNYKSTSVSLSDDIRSRLRNYQLDGVKWLKTLANHSLSGILADDMGLGKTIQIISLLSTFEVDIPSIIVTPKSLIYNWEHEFSIWNPKQKVVVIDGNSKKRREQINENGNIVYIISYESLRNDVDFYENKKFFYVILDEGQHISNVIANKTKAVKKIDAVHKLVLTGTPIQNSLIDLWSIFDFLLPSYLPNLDVFSTEYAKLDIDDDKKKQLSLKISPFILRRTKAEVLFDLPKKEERIFKISMNEKQRKFYSAYLMGARDSLNNKDGSKKMILAEITKLREICLDPKSYIEKYDEEGEKLNFIIPFIQNAIINDNKVLIFSSFVKCLYHLKDMLKEVNLDSYLICGDTDAKDRKDMAYSFNTDPEKKIMLVSLKAGGEGLNLIGANFVVHLDPWWNVSSENQASDRAYRIGQKRNVTIYKLICKDSIEERVIELQELKKKLTNVISDDDSMMTSLNIDDLKFLLS